MLRRMLHPHAPLAAIICLENATGSGPTVWIANPRANPRLGVRLVKLLRQRMRRRSLIHPHQVLEPPQDHIPGLRHQVPSQRSGRVRQALLMPGTSRIQQQPRRLNRIPADDHHARPLEVFLPCLVEVHDPVRSPILAHRHPRHHAVVANLRSVLDAHPAHA